MWELDYKESWALKNWCFWTVVLEKSLENPLDCKEIQPVHLKRNQSWIFIGRTDIEAPILQRTDSLEKTMMMGKIEGGKRRGWQRMKWLDGITHWMDMSLSKIQVSLVCCSPWGRQRVRHNWATELNWYMKRNLALGGSYSKWQKIALDIKR